MHAVNPEFLALRLDDVAHVPQNLEVRELESVHVERKLLLVLGENLQVQVAEQVLAHTLVQLQESCETGIW